VTSFRRQGRLPCDFDERNYFFEELPTCLPRK
jgi:hypothetical protein